MTEPVVSDGTQFLSAVRYQLAFYLRTWRFVALVLLTAIVSVVVLALDAYQGSAAVHQSFATSSDFLKSFLSNIGTDIILVAAFLGGDAIAIDFGGPTGYLLLPLPIRRPVLLAGRFVAAALATIAVGLVYFAFGIGGALYFYGTLPLALAASLGLAVLFVLAALSIAFFLSSLLRSPAVSMIFTVLLLILVLPIALSVGEFTGSEPWYSLTYGGQVISNVLSSSFQHETVVSIRKLTIYTWSPYLYEGVAILLAYLAVFLTLSFLIYRRKELKG